MENIDQLELVSLSEIELIFWNGGSGWEDFWNEFVKIFGAVSVAAAILLLPAAAIYILSGVEAGILQFT